MLGMLLFCELLLLVWKQRASFPSRKWTALPPLMMHNWNTFIHSGWLQWGRPLRTNYYSLANVRESLPFNIIFWSFLLRFDYSSLQTLNPRRPLPPSHPFPSVWLTVSRSLPACAVVNFKQAGCWFSVLFGWHKQAQWVIHTILKKQLVQQRLLISRGLQKQIITAKLKPRTHRKNVIISRIRGAAITTRVLNCFYFLLARPSGCFRCNNGTTDIPAPLHTSQRWLMKSMDGFLRLWGWKHRNVWFCCVIALIPVIQPLHFLGGGFPARRDIKTPLHGQCLMQEQRFTFQIFSFAPSSVYCSSKYHLHIPFQTDAYHKLCVCFPPFRSQLNVMAVGLFLA